MPFTAEDLLPDIVQTSNMAEVVGPSIAPVGAIQEALAISGGSANVPSLLDHLAYTLEVPQPAEERPWREMASQRRLFDPQDPLHFPSLPKAAAVVTRARTRPQTSMFQKWYKVF